ncbi:MAG: amino acid ABC transporter permease [Myxacorys chilensis ATA2-1-KO14]|jgi:polar amino acid transport system permease protein|nr:amino acid ABC transporter permease [Myxacorys chilensis ATA2-1-KO14]
MSLRFDLIWEQAPAFLSGLWNTVWICAIGISLSLILGILLLLPLFSHHKVVRLPTKLLVEAARAIPFLMLAYLVYYGLPSLGLTLDSWSTAILTIVIYNAAYVADILRSAWVNLPKGQTEAARACGFTGVQLLRRIVLPQILIAAAPILGNQAIQVIRDSSFLAIITVPELTFTAKAVQADSFVPFESFITAALLYWVLCLLIEFGVQRLEWVRNFYGKA